MRRIKLALATMAVVGLSVLGFQAPAQAATNLGGVSMDAACDYQRGSTTYPVLMKITGNNVYDWRCRLNLGGSSSYWKIDVTKECRRVHGNSAYSKYLDYNNPYSWRCFR